MLELDSPAWLVATAREHFIDRTIAGASNRPRTGTRAEEDARDGAILEVMTKATDDEGQPILGINVTPLVDVTLVLLIVFMITAKAVASPAIPLPLPTSSRPGSVESVLRVDIAPNGALAIDGASVADGASLARAAATKAQAFGTGRDTRAVIAAAKTASHGSVVGAIDALRSVGIEKIAFAVEAPPQRNK